ncbi:DNA-directed RNA polymerase II subunit RPB9, putative [Entamoeba dispar SAW760]|uniref:DNA-directed RNA polymerase II subunit RPB9, putative n=1 Tax=Entamoeba dispar (strain ATCC PRA-260 / SAW760) TaxID=370354 RepID=B0EPA6_ENTDS|nr:DNA-directed RNA polymerase II subunit RPB9, putative [Entamoeba dispar SAW760]EDR23643.1 DNA-directed RNA polymerase II subunit RPB9, putative [Entamoeba dispar SAW760]|eukprot:EDR23643.1 DNA-directed RNA polymerase II subunit RPB9, putative [Entamoeba dispar SAW760]
MAAINAVKPHFCPDCHQIMLPRSCGDDLYFVCRRPNCGHFEKAEDPTSFCVYIKNFSETKATTVAADVSKDPTYPKTTKLCPHCGQQHDAVYYYSAHWNYNCSLQINYQCTNCMYSWAEGGIPFDKKEKREEGSENN